MIKVPDHIDQGGKIIVDESAGLKVTNVDVEKTVKDWFGIVNHDGVVVGRGVWGRRARIEGGYVCLLILERA